MIVNNVKKNRLIIVQVNRIDGKEVKKCGICLTGIGKCCIITIVLNNLKLLTLVLLSPFFCSTHIYF